MATVPTSVETPTVGWLLQSDGTVSPLIAARRQPMFGGAVVTHTDGREEIVNAHNVLAPDNLDQRLWF